uniref:Uncharacterized protein n=1 Tax=Rhodnius prolixus TaxID=13249 RepID=T1HK57_RHOPR
MDTAIVLYVNTLLALQGKYYQAVTAP